MKKNKINIFIIALFLLTFFLMSVGFAQYGQIVNFSGTVLVKPDGKVYISGVETTSLSARTTANPSVISGSDIDFGLKFTTTRNDQTSYEAKFKITITNNSSYDYVYTTPNYRPTAFKGNEDVSDHIDYRFDGINHGDKIDAKSQKSFYIIFEFDNPDPETAGTYTIGGNFVPTLDEDASARVMGAVGETQVGDLTGNNEIAEFNLDVENTYKVQKSFNIIIESDKFVVRNVNNVDYTVGANSRETFKFYIAKVDDAEYVSDTVKLRVSIVPTGEAAAYCGRVTVNVDPTVNDYVDETPPTISNVVAVKNIAEGSATVTWEGEDDSGTVGNYTITPYRNNSALQPVSVGDVESYSFTNLSEGNYYFVVQGEDPTGNQASASSNDVELKWNYRLTVNIGTNITSCTGTGMTGSNRVYTATVKLGSNYTITLRAANNYNLPTSGNVSASYNGSSYANYTYDRNAGTIVVKDIPGDITVTVGNAVSQGCLVQGTKILLADNTYKNVEDIEYTDLLKVYDHVNGALTEVYPIFIEEECVNELYRKITFSDGTYLNVVEKHSLFDVDKKQYVNVANKNEFNIGSRVYKIKNNQLEAVTVTNIECIQETVKFYNIISACYYNVIANDLITTDTTSSISNIYGFEDNAIYGENYYKISNGEKLEYEDANFVPYYLYKGLNLQNAKTLLKNDISGSFLEEFVRNNAQNPIVKNGKMYFSVTTSLDEISDNNKDKYLYEEGSIYKLPMQDVKYFIETSTNQRYEPGDKVKVEYSIHFRAVK